MTHTTGSIPRSAYCRTTLAVSAGAPQTSMTASAKEAGRSSGSFVAIVRPNKIAYPAHGTCSLRPSHSSRPSVTTSGVRVSDTKVVIGSPTSTSRLARGPTSSTTPISMPPEPVTGLCIFPQRVMMSSTSARTAAPSPWCLTESWRNDAASRLSLQTRTRTSSGQSSQRVSRRTAAWGSTPGGSRTRCRPVGSLDIKPPSGSPARRKSSGMPLATPQVLP
jgi:hypothetical protein